MGVAVQKSWPGHLDNESQQLLDNNSGFETEKCSSFSDDDDETSSQGTHSHSLENQDSETTTTDSVTTASPRLAANADCGDSSAIAEIPTQDDKGSRLPLHIEDHYSPKRYPQMCAPRPTTPWSRPHISQVCRGPVGRLPLHLLRRGPGQAPRKDLLRLELLLSMQQFAPRNRFRIAPRAQKPRSAHVHLASTTVTDDEKDLLYVLSDWGSDMQQASGIDCSRAEAPVREREGRGRTPLGFAIMVHNDSENEDSDEDGNAAGGDYSTISLIDKAVSNTPSSK